MKGEIYVSKYLGMLEKHSEINCLLGFQERNAKLTSLVRMRSLSEFGLNYLYREKY